MHTHACVERLLYSSVFKRLEDRKNRPHRLRSRQIRFVYRALLRCCRFHQLERGLVYQVNFIFYTRLSLLELLVQHGGLVKLCQEWRRSNCKQGRGMIEQKTTGLMRTNSYTSSDRSHQVTLMSYRTSVKMKITKRYQTSRRFYKFVEIYQVSKDSSFSQIVDFFNIYSVQPLQFVVFTFGNWSWEQLGLKCCKLMNSSF